MNRSPDGLPPLRDVIARFELAAKKSLGQNFLLDLNLTSRIARNGGPLDQGTVFEIGPGPGGLTRGLLMEGAQEVIAVEKDQRCLNALAEVSSAYAGKLTVIEQDALTVDFSTLGSTPRRIVANLPYNISTVLLLRWLKQIAADPTVYASLTLMFQKEVVDRLTASPGTKSYGRLSVMTQWLCRAQALFDIPPRAFIPPPKITSTVVRLEPHAAPLAPAEVGALEKVTESAFGQRRKMLRQSLKTLGVATGELIERAGVRETARAEELSVEEFCTLARCYQELKEAKPAS
ncbi:16S rRNA (adenine(1518)-N(6)/adenine(1519)-N(6))-dimethyltransferase RsmA [Kiloniella laminariae]|uniref:Ribosomal RNA small subunit methyltransferase A n=1 Tax=Kiloniella laminariae TaxID=454162 RepID=A0ABT4LH04_9PROT|nr:16S rRNA (adenine(1518)-N(6)/adenine(1519)-N(6))-dimethyltransferase RsmA [Kiloniella laminariae]MCZ4280386.1 16S rRNA (adenine(1518)-N(6)/adenine(1519)-N(6))-dimethyltransferase RsmA [Kiloniella laminariae]